MAVSEDQQRRSDDVDPATRLFVKEAVSDAKHSLRNDIAELGTRVAAAQMLSTKEHSEVAAKLDQLGRELGDLKPLAADVAALKLADARAEVLAAAAEQQRAQSRTQFRWLVGLIVAAVPSIAVLVQLFSH